MQEFIGNIRRIGPGYPLSPVRPVDKDSEKRERQQKKPPPRPAKDEDSDEGRKPGGRRPFIDERV